MPLEPEILVRHMIFTNPKGHSYYPENFRCEAYGLNEIHFRSNFDWVRHAFGTAVFRQTFDFYHLQQSWCYPENFRSGAYELNKSHFLIF